MDTPGPQEPLSAPPDTCPAGADASQFALGLQAEERAPGQGKRENRPELQRWSVLF
jgi:hypothetical protein